MLALSLCLSAAAACSVTGDLLPGGQSGGESDSELPGPIMPCACLNGGTLGEVLTTSASCAEVRVTGSLDVFPAFSTGTVLGGLLNVACPGSAPLQAGDQVVFQYQPGGMSECPALRACTASRCATPPGDIDARESQVDTSFECNQGCMDETLEACSDPADWELQTGLFSALSVSADVASFSWAGEVRMATLDELQDPGCQALHQAQKDAYEQLQAQAPATPSPPRNPDAPRPVAPANLGSDPFSCLALGESP